MLLSHSTKKKVLWSLCPKEQFISPPATSFAISLADCLYNSGLEYKPIYKPIENAGLKFDPCLQGQ